MNQSLEIEEILKLGSVEALKRLYLRTRLIEKENQKEITVEITHSLNKLSY